MKMYEVNTNLRMLVAASSEEEAQRTAETVVLVMEQTFTHRYDKVEVQINGELEISEENLLVEGSEFEEVQS
jgi:hypothetical protein